MDRLVKQPHEKYTVAVEYAGKLPSGQSLASGVALAADLTEAALSTTLAAASAADAATVSLATDVKGGALLTINPGGANQEVVHVSSISGSGPYTATILGPLTKAHSSSEPVAYYPGVSAEVLQSTVATISGTQAKATVKKGQHGRQYKVTMFVTLANGENLEDDVPMLVEAR